MNISSRCRGAMMSAAVLCLVGLIPQSYAATLTGDQVAIEGNPANFGPALVGPGTDLTIGNFNFDFDAGVGNDEFAWTSGAAGAGLGSITGSFSLTSLDFSGGEVLIGFELSTTLLSNLTFATAPNSIMFIHTSVGGSGLGTVIAGRFLTAPAPVPLPAALPLFGTALALLGFGAWRRRRRQVAA